MATTVMSPTRQFDDCRRSCVARLSANADSGTRRMERVRSRSSVSSSSSKGRTAERVYCKDRATIGLMRRAFAVALLLFAAAPSFAEERDPRVAWLAEHALRVRSLDPHDDDFADLEPLRKTLAGARVVMLGEQNHSDGPTFL